MKAWAWMCVAALALSTAGVAACGGGGGSAKFAHVKAGDMPQGETWVGVYFNPVYGYLHVIEQDGNIVGRWKRADGSHWGELSGSAEGAVLHFTWKEHQYGNVGPSSVSSGSGVFVYKIDNDGTPELDGQYALDDSDNAGQWHCVKQAQMKPDLNSINGNSPTTGIPATTDQWK
jgi:hypothetical protein